MSGRFHLVLAALAALPLGSGAQEMTSPAAPPAIGDAAPGDAGLAPGEEIEWRVDFLGVKTGRARLAVGRPEGEIWPVIAQAKTEGVATLLQIKEHYVSYWHSAERRSNGNDLEALEIGDHHTERQRFDRAQGKATVTWWRKGRGEKQKVVEIPSDVHDLASAMLWLRVQPLEAGARYEIPVFTGDEIFTLRAAVADRERVSTGIGDVDAIRVDVQLGFKAKFETRRASHIWFSADLRHVPVKMSAEFAVGSVVATVTTYKPGSQVARR
jgi:hypothetical protein